MLSLSKKHTFYIGKWEVDPLHNTIRQGSEQYDIEPKAMQVLEYLARYAGQTVHRDALFKAFWPNQIVTEEALTRVISHLRHCLADIPKSPRYIVTVRKTGYRLIAKVSSGDYFTAYPGDNTDTKNESHQPTSRPVRFLNLLTKSATFSIATLLIYLIFNQPTVSGGSQPKAKYITSDLGAELAPTLSPNGQDIAYVKMLQDKENKDRYYDGLFVKNIASNKTKIIAHPNGRSGHPTWAPDNLHIAFVNEVELNESETQYGIYKTNILTSETELMVYTSAHNHGITWSPDGRYLVYPDGPDQNKSKHLYRFDTFSGQRDLILPLEKSDHSVFSYPKYSPDGNYIAVIRTDQGAYDSIDLLDIQNNSVKSILNSEPSIASLEWKNNSTLFVVSGKTGTSQLLEYSINTDKTNYIDLDDKNIEYLSYSRTTERLVYESINCPQNIFVTNFTEKDYTAKDFVPFTHSNREELEAIERQDGRYTAIISSRSDAFDIWLRDNLEHQSQKLTSLNAHSISGMDWSPDLNKLVFVATIDHKQAIYWVNLDDKNLKMFAHDIDSHYSLIGWQNDNTLLFSSDYNEQWKLWRYYTDSKSLELVSDKAIMHGRLSPDRKALYFVIEKEPGIWKSDIGGNSLTQVSGTENISVFKSWAVAEDGIFYFMYGKAGKPEELFFLNFESSKSPLVAWIWYVNLNRIYWSNHRLYYSVHEKRESDVALVEGL